MIDLKSMTLEEMGTLMKEMGEPAFRAKQVFQWLHRGVTSFDEMSNLSKDLRERLKETCILTVPAVERNSSPLRTAPSSICGALGTEIASKRF